MGLVEKMAEKGARIIQERLRKEYEKAGSTARTEIETISFDQAVRSGQVVRDVAVGFWGGQITPESLWVLRLENSGFLHWYIQPFSKIALLPGEHHAILSGAISETARLGHAAGDFGPPTWWSEDAQFAEALNRDAALKKICNKVRWMWRVAGVARMEYKAPLQLRNVGDGRTHIALRSGDYGRSRVGFQVFIDICNVLKRYTTVETVYPETTFRTAYGYSAIVLSDR